MSFDGSEDGLYPCEAQVSYGDEAFARWCGDMGDVSFMDAWGNVRHFCHAHYGILYKPDYKLLLCYA